MIIIVVAILLSLLPRITHAQLISHQNWQSATVASDAIAVSCASLLLPFELGRLLTESTPTVSRGEMDSALRAAHPIKVSLQPESGTSDNISSITGCTTNGARIQLATVDTGDTITVVHTPGAIEFAGGANVVLDSPLKILTLQRKSGIWVADGGLGGGSSGGGGILLQEECSTAGAIGQICVDTDTGHVYRGTGTGTQPLSVLYYDDDCSTFTSIAHLCLDTDDGHVYRGDGTASHRMSAIHYDNDCSPYADIGELCIDTDDGLVYYGDDVEASVIGSGAAGTQSLQSAFSFGKVISGANSQANAMVVGNGTDGFRFYNNIIECFQGASTCDITFDIPTGRSLRIKYAGTEGIVINSSGITTLNNALIEYKTYWFGAGAISVDGTNCTDPVERVINGGPKTWVLKCGDNVGSIFYGSVTMRDGYNGGSVWIALVAENENAPPSGVLDFDISAMCRSDSDTIDATWGAAAAVAMTMNTQYDVEHQWSAEIIPNGPCAAGDTLFWRAVMDATATTTQVANTYILGMKMKYPTNKWSD